MSNYTLFISFKSKFSYMLQIMILTDSEEQHIKKDVFVVKNWCLVECSMRSGRVRWGSGRARWGPVGYGGVRLSC